VLPLKSTYYLLLGNFVAVPHRKNLTFFDSKLARHQPAVSYARPVAQDLQGLGSRRLAWSHQP
jgi:hypothetical protein